MRISTKMDGAKKTTPPPTTTVGDQFVKDVQGWGMHNPFNPREIVVNNEAIIEVERNRYDAPDVVVLHTVRVVQQKQGAGTRIMQRLVDHADSMGITLRLLARPLSQHAPNKPIPLKKLFQFYTRFGFEGTIMPGDGKRSKEYMVRYPKGK